MAESKRKRKSAEARRNDIAEAARIAPPTLFLPFGNKIHVLVALVDAAAEKLRRHHG